MRLSFIAKRFFIDPYSDDKQEESLNNYVADNLQCPLLSRRLTLLPPTEDVNGLHTFILLPNL